MMKTTEKLKGILTGMLALLYLVSFINLTFFTHSHCSPEGRITHSHPYKSASHTHSTAEFQFISSTGNFIAIITATADPLFIEVMTGDVSGICKDLTGTDAGNRANPRAPPVTALSRS